MNKMQNVYFKDCADKVFEQFTQLDYAPGQVWAPHCTRQNIKDQLTFVNTRDL